MICYRRLLFTLSDLLPPLTVYFVWSATAAYCLLWVICYRRLLFTLSDLLPPLTVYFERFATAAHCLLWVICYSHSLFTLNDLLRPRTVLFFTFTRFYGDELVHNVTIITFSTKYFLSLQYRSYAHHTHKYKSLTWQTKPNYVVWAWREQYDSTSELGNIAKAVVFYAGGRCTLKPTISWKMWG